MWNINKQLTFTENSYITVPCGLLMNSFPYSCGPRVYNKYYYSGTPLPHTTEIRTLL